ncbi:hypothetical protein [Serratia fonticola]|jgi:uncharacterized membrane protein YjfL (UPF0719 family)
MKEKYSPAWWLVTTLFSLLLGGILSFLLFPHLLLWAGLSLFICMLLWHISERYQSSLVARINKGSSLQVAIDLSEQERVCVSDTQLATIQQRILLNPKTGLEQMWNVTWTSIKLSIAFVIVVPVIVFWLVVALVMFLPLEAAEILMFLRDSTPLEIIQALQATASYQGTIVSLCVTIFAFSVPIMLIIGLNPGLKNCWREALKRQLQPKTNLQGMYIPF